MKNASLEIIVSQDRSNRIAKRTNEVTLETEAGMNAILGIRNERYDATVDATVSLTKEEALKIAKALLAYATR